MILKAKLYLASTELRIKETGAIKRKTPPGSPSLGWKAVCYVLYAPQVLPSMFWTCLARGTVVTETGALIKSLLPCWALYNPTFIKCTVRLPVSFINKQHLISRMLLWCGLRVNPLGHALIPEMAPADNPRHGPHFISFTQN